MIVFSDLRKSRGCRDLRFALNESGTRAIKLKVRNSKHKFDTNKHLYINWGNGLLDFGLNANATNASNKVKSMLLLGDIAVKSFFNWNDLNERDTYYARTLTTASQGRGIVIGKKHEIPTNCSLYTKKVLGEEYRVHVFKDKILQIQKKRQMTDEELTERGLILNPAIKNHDNGWLFIINGFEIPEGLKEIAIKAVKKLNLDFGAVDIIYNFYPKVLEVNTAPGLTKSRLTLYKDAIIEYYNNNKRT